MKYGKQAELGFVVDLVNNRHKKPHCCLYQIGQCLAISAIHLTNWYLLSSLY